MENEIPFLCKCLYKYEHTDMGCSCMYSAAVLRIHISNYMRPT